MNTGFIKIIKAYGSQSALANKCNEILDGERAIKQQTISWWLKYGIPSEMVMVVKKAADDIQCNVSIEELLPSNYVSKSANGSVSKKHMDSKLNGKD